MSATTTNVKRPEIQALRAIAVLGVVSYHLWPHDIRGGYVGVDIFFVISGFLITSHLMREVGRTGRIRLVSFWARRARRLLPAGLVVIAVSFVATIAFVPSSLWNQFSKEFAASTLYVENWLLAYNSVDYLASTNIASPVQHYWSLSVEEQFYIVWPLLILLAIAMALVVKRVSRRRMIALILGAVTVVSFAFCIYFTYDHLAPAYFVTPTRAWEFGLGGLLAIALEKQGAGRPVLRTIVSWAGLAGIVATVLLFTPSLTFPGWVALAPTVATVAVIYAGTPATRFAPSTLLRLAPVQWVGDVSYSFYLWHWPPIVILPFALDVTTLSALDRWAIFAGALLLAWLTRRFVEDPVRGAGWLVGRSAWRTIALTAVAMAVVVGASGTTILVDDSVAAAEIARSEHLTMPDTPCLGAAAFDPANQPCVNPQLAGQLLPTTAGGERDWVVSPGMVCRSGVGQPGVTKCNFNYGSAETVALVGDSHAEHWLPAVMIIAKKHGWTVDTYLKGGCPFSAVARTDNASTAKGTCTAWNTKVMATLSQKHYDLVITSQVTGTTFARGPGETSMQAGSRGLVGRWDELERLGMVVVAIRDDPQMPGNVPQCLSALKSRAAADARLCGGTEDKARRPDPQIEAARESGAGLIDLTPYFCEDSLCPAVIGSVVVYRDDAHLGGTFSRTLSPYIDAQLSAYLSTLPGGRPPTPAN